MINISHFGGKKSKLSFKFDESIYSKFAFTFELETLISNKLSFVHDKKLLEVFMIMGSEGMISFGSIISFPIFLNLMSVLVSVLISLSLYNIFSPLYLLIFSDIRVIEFL